jgi:hypothetical protein
MAFDPEDPDLVMNYIAEWKEEIRTNVALSFGSWPDDRSGLWNPIFDALKKANRAIAWKVKDLLAATPPKSIADATRELPALIVRARQETNNSTAREKAYAASMSCSEDDEGNPAPCDLCGAMGILPFQLRGGEPFKGKTAGGHRHRMNEIVYTCPACPMGEWMATNAEAFPKYADAGHRIIRKIDTTFADLDRWLAERDAKTWPPEKPDGAALVKSWKREPRRRVIAKEGGDYKAPEQAGSVFDALVERLRTATTPTHGNAEAFKTQLARELTPARAGVPF